VVPSVELFMSTSPRLPCIVEARDPWSGARALTIRTMHGEVQTPIFMPVATQAALKFTDLDDAKSLDYQILLANTYHLLIRPGPEVFEKHGDIHRFMRWHHSVLTDSGGFQLFSLAKQISMSEEGASFRSYTDGRRIVLTPERSIQMQKTIGSDIMMVLDHCISSTSDEATTRAALELTTRWAKRSLEARGDSPQALFGIVQGGCFPHLRQESADQICQIPFDGFALGGLAVGETKAEREDTTEFAAQLLPADKPRYLMGVGTPIDLLEAVRRGIDMFDCIMPTSLGGQGVAFTSRGKVDLRRGVYKFIDDSLDKECSCSTCARFSRSYLHHLVKAKEPIVTQLVSHHNLTFYRSLMRRMREAIIQGTFKELYHREAPLLVGTDSENPPLAQPRRRRPLAA
jgi:queuine tRNA-ribosyltransferase